jgi:hypothetical protein
LAVILKECERIASATENEEINQVLCLGVVSFDVKILMLHCQLVVDFSLSAVLSLSLEDMFECCRQIVVCRQRCWRTVVV